MRPVPMPTRNLPLLRAALLALASLLAVRPGHALDTDFSAAGGTPHLAPSEADALARPGTLALPITKGTGATGLPADPLAPGRTADGASSVEDASWPATGTRIVPSSLRVLYGLIRIDLGDATKYHAASTRRAAGAPQANDAADAGPVFAPGRGDPEPPDGQDVPLRVGAAW